MPKARAEAEPEAGQPPVDAGRTEGIEDPTPPDGTPGRPGAPPADLDRPVVEPQGDEAVAAAESDQLDRGREAPLTWEQKVEEARRRRLEREQKRRVDRDRYITAFQREFPGFRPGMTREEYLAQAAYGGGRQQPMPPPGPAATGGPEPEWPEDIFEQLTDPTAARRWLDGEFARFLQSAGPDMLSQVLGPVVAQAVQQEVGAWESLRETRDLTLDMLPEEVRGHPMAEALVTQAIQQAAQDYDVADEQELAEAAADIALEFMDEMGLSGSGGAKPAPAVPAGQPQPSKGKRAPRTQDERKRARRELEEKIREQFWGQFSQ